MPIRLLMCLAVGASLILGMVGSDGSVGFGGTADEIHRTLTGQRSVTFDWRGTATSIRYGLTTACDNIAMAQAPKPVPFSSSSPFRETKLTGLQAHTVYHYSIGSGPDHSFRTPLSAGSSGFTVDVEGNVGA